MSKLKVLKPQVMDQTQLIGIGMAWKLKISSLTRGYQYPFLRVWFSLHCTAKELNLAYILPRLILMRRGNTPVERPIEIGENGDIIKALELVWKGELDGIMVMRS